MQFLGADSVAAGQTSNTRWQLGNSDHIAFTMAWTLTDGRGWPGFPKSGTVDIAPVSTQVLTVAVLAPDTAVVGVNALHMTVTLRDGSTATADGAIQISGTGP